MLHGFSKAHELRGQCARETAREVHDFGCFSRDIVNNKIAAGEVGDDLRKVASTLSDTVTQTERTVEKKVSTLRH